MEERKSSKKSFKSRAVGSVLVTLGCILVICALVLVYHNYQESESAGAEAQEDLPQVVEVIRQAREEQLANPKPEEHVNPYDPLEVEQSQAMTENKINGYPYIGYLNIPEFQLELPVMSSPTGKRLQIAPCRHMGSTKTNNIVIAAHNYPSHFGHLKDLTQGECDLLYGYGWGHGPVHRGYGDGDQSL